MKKLDKSIGREVLRRLNRDRSFDDSISFAYENSIQKPYLVGGRLYRTIIEILFGYPARSSCSDYDWASTELIVSPKKKRLEAEILGTQYDATNNSFKPPKRLKEVSEGCFCPKCYQARRKTSIGKYSGNSRKRTTIFRCSMDLIDIKTLSNVKDNSIEGYLEAVPLTIQSIAMDIESLSIFGDKGIEAIKEQYVGVNNIEALLGHSANKPVSPSEYIEDKAKSLRFSRCEIKLHYAEGHKKKAEKMLKKIKLGDGINFIPSNANNNAIWTTTTASDIGWTWSNISTTNI